jgi:hypothetical protein
VRPFFIGVVACCVAAIRGHDAGWILAWFGIFQRNVRGPLFTEVPAGFRLLAADLRLKG